MKHNVPNILEFFSLQNETKMKQIGDYDPFFDFFMFQLKRWVGVKKKSHNSSEREIFLNIGKNRNSLAIKSAEIKGDGITFFLFFLPHYGKKQTIKPALRSLRLGKILTRSDLLNQIILMFYTLVNNKF
jgi:hypothetical protein